MPMWLASLVKKRVSYEKHLFEIPDKVSMLYGMLVLKTSVS